MPVNALLLHGYLKYISIFVVLSREYSYEDSNH